MLLFFLDRLGGLSSDPCQGWNNSAMWPIFSSGSFSSFFFLLPWDPTCLWNLKMSYCFWANLLIWCIWSRKRIYLKVTCPLLEVEITDLKYLTHRTWHWSKFKTVDVQHLGDWYRRTSSSRLVWDTSKTLSQKTKLKSKKLHMYVNTEGTLLSGNLTSQW